MSSLLRTFVRKPFVVVTVDGPVVSFADRLDATTKATSLREQGARVVDLSDVEGFSEAAATAGDLAGAYVAGLALGRTCAELAEHYGVSRADVASAVRGVLGGLSRRAARRQVAAWILEGACG
jgi:hypothetical protein